MRSERSEEKFLKISEVSLYILIEKLNIIRNKRKKDIRWIL